MTPPKPVVGQAYGSEGLNSSASPIKVMPKDPDFIFECRMLVSEPDSQNLHSGCCVDKFLEVTRNPLFIEGSKDPIQFSLLCAFP